MCERWKLSYRCLWVCAKPCFGNGTGHLEQNSKHSVVPIIPLEETYHGVGEAQAPKGIIQGCL